MGKKFIEVQGRQMAYVQAGSGDPIVFLHGNPTSSYLWRNIWPDLKGYGCCIAPDLFGFGDSDKLPPTQSNGEDQRYSFEMHARSLEEFLEKVTDGQRIVLVVHDWGSALGFDWAARNEEKTRGIAYMESLISHRRYEDMTEQAQQLFKGVRSSEAIGRKLILEENMFVEQGLPGFVMRELSPEEMNSYREPFAAEPEHRRPILSFQRELPIDGNPKQTHDVFERYMEWLKTTKVPKLFVNADPGYQISGSLRDLARTFPNQTEITVRGLHYVQEDSPEAISTGIAAWLENLSGIDTHHEEKVVGASQ